MSNSNPARRRQVKAGQATKKRVKRKVLTTAEMCDRITGDWDEDDHDIGIITAIWNNRGLTRRVHVACCLDGLLDHWNFPWPDIGITRFIDLPYAEADKCGSPQELLALIETYYAIETCRG